MRAYLDSSVILRKALSDGPLLGEWEALSHVVISDLTEVECLRTVDSARFNERIAQDAYITLRIGLQELFRSTDRIALTPAILRRASDRFPVPLKTLDAIHIATALTVRDVHMPDLVFATHDQKLAFAARTMGFHVIGP